MSVLTPTTPLRHCQNRVANLLEGSPEIDDATLLDFFDEAHKMVCVRGELTATVTTLTLASGTAEYDLPGDCAELRQVWLGGIQLDVVKNQAGQEGLVNAFYQRPGLLGLSPVPDSSGPVTILYTATPDTLTSFDDDLLVSWEWLHVLIDWVKYRIAIETLGAEAIGYAMGKRALVDLECQRLRGMSPVIPVSMVRV